MKRTASLSAGLAAVALIGTGAFTAQALSGEEPALALITQVAVQTSSQAPPPAEVAPAATGKAHAAELTARLTGANVLSGKHLVGVRETPGPLQFYPIGESSSDGYKATAIIEDVAGKSTLTVFVQSAKSHECTAATNCTIATPVPQAHAPALGETTVTRVDGTVIQVTTAADNGKVKMRAAQAKLPDGTVVTAVIRAEVEKYDGVPETVSSRADVPLTEEQIVALVERPGFHY